MQSHNLPLSSFSARYSSAADSSSRPQQQG